MIKLNDLLKELNKPSNVYAPGMEPKDEPNEEFFKKGFKITNKDINSETGTITSDVEYLPEFDQIKTQLLKFKKEFQSFKFSTYPDVSKLSKEINTSLTKVSNMISTLDKMIEFHKKFK